jgi:peptidoglycan/LPS O-acetylase OafA/YrhL
MGVLIEHTIVFRNTRWWWDRSLIGGSWTGVDLFFVISGFLISGLLFSEFQKRGRINFARFAIRRALKLYPTLYVLVFGTTLWRLIHADFHDLVRIIKPALHDIFFVQSYFPGTYGHFWSLSVEEHFYILLPLTFYFMLRKRAAGDTDPFRKLPLIFLLVAVFSLAVRIVHAVLVQPYDNYKHLYPTHLRLDSLLFGVVLSYWSLFHRERFSALINWSRPFLLPISLLLIMPAFISKPIFIIYTVQPSSLYLGYGGLMISLLQVPLTTTKSSYGWLLRPMSYIGQHSYPIYVFHIEIMLQLLKHNLLHGFRGLVLYFVCTIGFGILVSKAIEFPVLHLRDRIFPPVAVAEIPTGVSLKSESAVDKRLVDSRVDQAI